LKNLTYVRVALFALVLMFLLGATTAQGADESSADEMAKELANPNTALTSLTFRFQHYSFGSDSEEADGLNMTQVFFQPTLPFPFESGKTLWFRPGIPFIFDQPVYDPVGAEFGSENGLGDTTVDLQYGGTWENGFLWSVGPAFILPTATADELGLDLWVGGPGFQLGHIAETTIFGIYANRQWDFAGEGDSEVDLTAVQLFAILTPGGGWSWGSKPIMTYDNISEDWAVPVNLGVSKTVLLNERPWKFEVELSYYVERPESFGTEWMVALNVEPVVTNIFYSWFKG
jgi:hypothetical protein